MKSHSFTRLLLCGVAVIGLGLADASIALAQTHGGGEKGSGRVTDSGHGSGGAKRGGTGSGAQRGGGGGSLRDVFSDMDAGVEGHADAEEGATEDGKKGQSGRQPSESSTAEKGTGRPEGKGKASGSGRQPSENSTAEKGSGRPEGKGKTSDTVQGQRGGKTDVAAPSGEEEDSDRPAWAGVSGPGSKPGRGGSTKSGTKKGDIYGDLYIVVRDENGVPILDENSSVQVMYSDADGNLTCCIPRDAEGDLLPTLGDGTAVLPVEVEFGRLSVGRSPSAVLAAQYEEAINLINSAETSSLDASGRIVLTYSDGTVKTIDSPLANLALYVELLNTGTLAGVDASTLGDLSYLADGALTPEDLAIAASFFAAASDKTIPLTTDAIVYMNSILNLDGELDGDYVDYSEFTYDREAVYGDMTIEALIEQADGSWVPTEVNVYDVVFSADSTGLLTNIEGFKTAADDARMVIDYIHQYAPPET